MKNLVYLLRPLALAQIVVSLVSCYEPYEPPSADLCLQIANEIYEISLDEALRDPKVWADYGYENEYHYANDSRSSVLARNCE